MLDKKEGGAELKNVDDPDEREKLLKDAIYLIEGYNVVGKNVLLLDDLYRSGATLSVATSILYEEAKVNSVNALTLTKTRSKR